LRGCMGAVTIGGRRTKQRKEIHGYDKN